MTPPNIIPSTNSQPSAGHHLINNSTIDTCANHVVDDTTPNILEYRKLIKIPDGTLWKQEPENDLVRLTQGVLIRMKKVTNTLFFIHPSKIPKHKNYLRKICRVNPLFKIRTIPCQNNSRRGQTIV